MVSDQQRVRRGLYGDIHEILVPEPFASMLLTHLQNRPNLQTTGNHGHRIWVFPSTRAGSHLHPGQRHRPATMTRHPATEPFDLVAEVPAAIVADMLGYSYAAAERHANAAAAAFNRYVGE